MRHVQLLRCMFCIFVQQHPYSIGKYLYTSIYHILFFKHYVIKPTLMNCRNIQKKCWTVGRLSVWVRIFESLLSAFLSPSTKATPWIHLYALVSRPDIFHTYHSRLVHIVCFSKKPHCHIFISLSEASEIVVFHSACSTYSELCCKEFKNSVCTLYIGYLCPKCHFFQC